MGALVKLSSPSHTYLSMYAMMKLLTIATTMHTSAITLALCSERCGAINTIADIKKNNGIAILTPIVG